jgi:hypothetical protein
MVAPKLGVALLERGHDSAMDRFFERLLPEWRQNGDDGANSTAVLESTRSAQAALGAEELRPRSEVILRTSPDYGFGNLLWNAILSDLPTEPKAYASELKDEALFALDSVWLLTRRAPDCPDCSGCHDQKRTPHD